MMNKGAHTHKHTRHKRTMYVNKFEALARSEDGLGPEGNGQDDQDVRGGGLRKLNRPCQAINCEHDEAMKMKTQSTQQCCIGQVVGEDGLDSFTILAKRRMSGRLRW